MVFAIYPCFPDPWLIVNGFNPKAQNLFCQKQYGFELMLNTCEARAAGQGLRSNPKVCLDALAWRSKLMA